ncbi:MAG: isoleucine--tRNA ligase [Oscillospiraceae bacterium]|nr:isoleucine--tRNA ligase [Oscillospiraceae bacterium]
MDYNVTVNLPKTDFPMRAGLPQREPKMLADWGDVYGQLMARNANAPNGKYIMHDGPPFSNGDIHAGHALNKILKDFIVRYRNMTGFQAPNTPGWDNHGLPIESAIIKKQKLNAETLSPVAFREACHAFAQDYVNRQRDSFIRLGALGDWDNPYLTMAPAFEAREVEVFGAMAEKGCLYKALKPVYWCVKDRTALAEAEIEYQEEDCESVYVKFAVKDGKGIINDAYFVIWTTTAWTLPGNMAVCLHPRADYVLVEAGDEKYILAEALVEAVSKIANWDCYTVSQHFKGNELEHIVLQHPFLDRDSLVIMGEHVTTESGTGCVHTAPGHGVDDFNVCQSYGLETIVPVTDKGIMTQEAGPFAGQYYTKAAKNIIQALRDDGTLLVSDVIRHTYPHCWRCGDPIIFRATEQWFVSIDAIRDAACGAVDAVAWLPAWGKERMNAMIVERNDWCISRQRNWGLPIPAFLCNDCPGYLVTPESIAKISDIFKRESSNAWFARDVAELLPEKAVCPLCGGNNLRKETDTLDGWFDSGCTHAHVLEAFPHMRRPADLYIEGNDQFRGWFQSSLLTSIAAYGNAPYKTVVTCGMVVDGDGKKMSKSLGNGIDPIDVCNEFGADVLRLWFASCDYHNDVRFSKDLIKQTAENYKKIRNTARFILGVLSDFEPNTMAVQLEEMLPLDKYILSRLNKLIEKVLLGYESFDFHAVSYALHNFCVTEMSNFYLDVQKDTLYCGAKAELPRRSAQTALHIILGALVRLMAPILCFTSEEIWQAMPHSKDDAEMALFAGMPQASPLSSLGSEMANAFEVLLAKRDEVNKALEEARAAGGIGKSLEASVSVAEGAEILTILRKWQDLLPNLFIVSNVTLSEGEPIITVKPAEGEKCTRCWIQSASVGRNAAHPELCARCAEVVSTL